MDQRAAFDETIELARRADMENNWDTVESLSFAHLLDMQARIHADTTMSEAKLGRWLGWAQASVVAADIGLTLDDMKQLNQRHSTERPSLEELDKQAGIRHPRAGECGAVHPDAEIFCVLKAGHPMAHSADDGTDTHGWAP